MEIFSTLYESHGLWPAATICLVWYVARSHRETILKIEATCVERLAEKNRRIETLEHEAQETIRAKDEELRELRRLALERNPRR